MRISTYLITVRTNRGGVGIEQLTALQRKIVTHKELSNSMSAIVGSWFVSETEKLELSSISRF
jgi:hypothetical protein